MSAIRFLLIIGLLLLTQAVCGQTYLNGMPTVNDVCTHIKGSNPLHTYTRQFATFFRLNLMLTDGSINGKMHNFTKGELELAAKYRQASKSIHDSYILRYHGLTPNTPEQKEWNRLINYYTENDTLEHEIVNTLFSPQVRQQYLKWNQHWQENENRIQSVYRYQASEKRRRDNGKVILVTGIALLITGIVLRWRVKAQYTSSIITSTHNQ